MVYLAYLRHHQLGSMCSRWKRSSGLVIYQAFLVVKTAEAMQVFSQLLSEIGIAAPSVIKGYV